MLNSTDTIAIDPWTGALSAGKENTSRKIVKLLDELLAHSLKLRNLYKRARCQASDIQHHSLRLLFDDHYREQLHLVDVLIDRVRMLGGAGRIFAGDFLQSSQFSGGLRSAQARSGLLSEIFDAHELILSAAGQGGKGDGATDNSSVRDFAVGQVVLVNELQSRSIGELLVGRTEDPRMSMPAALIAE
jgi:starvation-inducible DNA-binding protein